MSDDLKDAALAAGATTSEFSLAKAQTYIGTGVGLVFGLASLFEAHQTLIAAAEKVAPSSIASVLAVVVPAVIALAGFFKSARAHLIFAQGRLNLKATALQMYRDLEEGSRRRIADEARIAQAKAAGPFGDAIRGDAAKAATAATPAVASSSSVVAALVLMAALALGGLGCVKPAVHKTADDLARHFEHYRGRVMPRLTASPEGVTLTNELADTIHDEINAIEEATR